MLLWIGALVFTNTNQKPNTVKEGPKIPYMRFVDPPAELPVQHRPPGVEATHVVLTIATTADVVVCTHLTSAILSGVSPVIGGYTRAFSFNKKFEFAVEAVSALGLHDWDVMLLLDSDTSFTGEDVSSVMKEFDLRAPLHPDDINVRAVRRRDQWPPMLFHSEPNCFAPRVVSDEDCPSLYRTVYGAVDNALNATPLRRWIQRPEYLNSGAILMRVWALREFQRALELHNRAVPSLTKGQCDQSIATGLFLDMLSSEAQLGLLSPHPPPPSRKVPRTNQFGLHYGLIALDTDARLVVPLGYLRYQKVLITGKQHGVPLTSTITGVWPQRPRAQDLAETIMNHSRVKPLFTAKTVRGADGSALRTVQLTPSLLSGPVETADLVGDDPPQPVFPVLIHTPGHPKLDRMLITITFSGWNLALRYAPGYSEEARALVERGTIRAVVDRNTDKLLTMGALCQNHLENIFHLLTEQLR